ncbi:hypothetical protein [Phyllobacterium sp. YR531]|uniref:hypothetical protein n=1 Tax=Phyllobacterium sp. YR531 TaxID=1144343 RepID=UPI0012F636AA|nr:hypothetical protein [Phyllobacterium sp. YR531]
MTTPMFGPNDHDLTTCEAVKSGEMHMTSAANDNRKISDGFIPLVAFLVVTQVAATILLALPNWY